MKPSAVCAVTYTEFTGIDVSSSRFFRISISFPYLSFSFAYSCKLNWARFTSAARVTPLLLPLYRIMDMKYKSTSRQNAGSSLSSYLYPIVSANIQRRCSGHR